MSERDGYAPGVPCWVDTWQPDAATAADFYGGLFGWEVFEPTGGHAMCRLRGRDVAGIGSPTPDGLPVAWTTYVWVDDADALHAEFQAKGVTISREICDQPYGCRDFDVEDCNGYRLCFGHDTAG